MTQRKGILVVVLVKSFQDEQPSEKKLKFTWEPIAFDDDDLEGMTQPHDNALVVTARINGFIVKRVLVNQGSGANVMYPVMFRGFGLKNEDLSKYDKPLVGFDGRMVIPEGQILLPVNMEGKEVMVTFIVVNSFSPYTARLSRRNLSRRFPYSNYKKPQKEKGASYAKDLIKVKILLKEDRSFQIGDIVTACTEYKCICLEPIRGVWGSSRVYSS